MLQGGLLALLLVAVGTSSAKANWWGHPSYSSGYYYSGYYSVARYYPVVTPVFYFAQPATLVCPVPAVAPAVIGGAYAQPQPAPPSGKEPPLSKKTSEPPKVNESQSFSLGEGKAIPVATNGNGTGIRVGFWNVSGRDVKLTVAGKTYNVPRDRNVTLVLNRSFTWQVDSKESVTERVPDETSSHEIVIR
jgi:hypothetical protein